jgi:transketolase
MRTAFLQTLCELAVRDKRLWLVTGDLGYSVLEPFAERFPARYVNAGVAEQNMLGVAAGLAMAGNIVFTYSIANFATLRCLEQIRNDVCYHNLPVRIVAVGGGVAYGSAGYTHHAVEDLAILRALPQMTVVAPGDPIETRLATEALINWPGPAYLRLGKAGEPVIHSSPIEFTLGKALVVRDGGDVTLVSTGGMLASICAAAERLASGHNVACRVLSLHTLKPLDRAAIVDAANQTGGIVAVEEHSRVGGLGSAMAEVLLTERGLPRVPFAHVALPDEIRHGSNFQATLRPTVDQIVSAALSLHHAA